MKEQLTATQSGFMGLAGVPIVLLPVLIKKMNV